MRFSFEEQGTRTPKYFTPKWKLRQAHTKMSLTTKILSELNAKQTVMIQMYKVWQDIKIIHNEKFISNLYATPNLLLTLVLKCISCDYMRCI